MAKRTCKGCGNFGPTSVTGLGPLCKGCKSTTTQRDQQFHSVEMGGGGLLVEGGGGGYARGTQVLAAPPGAGLGTPGGGFGFPGGLLGMPGPLGGLGLLGMGMPRPGSTVIYVGSKKDSERVFVQTTDGKLVEVDPSDLKGTGAHGVCTKKNGVGTCIFSEKELKDHGLKLADSDDEDDK